MQVREFPYQTTRIAGLGFKYLFPVRCSKCGVEKDFESHKIMPDVFIHKKFMQWGWLLGRNRAYDICPQCLGVTRENKLASKFKVMQNCEPVPAPVEIVQQAMEKRESIQKVVHESLLRDRKFRELSKELTEVKDLLKEVLTVLKEMGEKKPTTRKTTKKPKELSSA